MTIEEIRNRVAGAKIAHFVEAERMWTICAEICERLEQVIELLGADEARARARSERFKRPGPPTRKDR